MTLDTDSAEVALPPLHMIDSEYDLIADLALQVQTRQPQLTRRLMDELDRATIHHADDLPPGVVTLGAQVDFVDAGSGAERSIRLVLPADADVTAGRVSILTPVGAGLIGLSEGSAIRWPDREGHPRELRIVRVVSRPTG